jgi:hypothetical protein
LTDSRARSPRAPVYRFSPSRGGNAVSVISDSTLPRSDGNTSVSCCFCSFNVLTISSAAAESGTRCGTFAFMRLPGTVQIPALRSNSPHVAPLTSQLRAG